MAFLDLKDKKILIFGIANRRSVAYHIARILLDEGAFVIASVQNEEMLPGVKKLLPDTPFYTCDFRSDEEMEREARMIKNDFGLLYGIVHSVAFANFASGIKPFHETSRKDFLEAVEISCWSLIKIAGLYSGMMEKNGSIVTISISTTRMAAENYGFMAPAKAALDSSIAFLAKSLSAFSDIRVNGVGAGLLKTSSSAGIPGYIEPYLFAEKIIPRKRNLDTEEVANAAVFLLSPRSSGINAQTIIVDAGMGINYFDKEIVKKVIQ